MRYPRLSKILSLFILLFLAIVLFTSLIMLIKYFIIAMAHVQEPVLKCLKILLSEENVKNNRLVQFTVVWKVLSLVISGLFVFLIYSMLSTVLSCIFYKFCSRNYRKILHPIKFSLIKGIKWQFYRIFLVLAPPFSIKAIANILIFSSLILFNFFLKFAGISISFTTFLVSFIVFSLVFLFILSLLVSLWQLFSTIFGMEIAVSEPRLSNKTIEMRSKKLILSRHYNILLCLSYFILIYSIIFQIKYALATDLLTNPANQNFLNLIIMFNLACLLIFDYLKSLGYINSLIEHNEKISKCPIKIVTV